MLREFAPGEPIDPHPGSARRRYNCVMSLPPTKLTSAGRHMHDTDIWKEFEHNSISHSAAHHLMAIHDLIERYGYARASDVAKLLNITRGSVSISLRPLKESGLVVQDENRHLRLSPAGSALVEAIKTKRHLLRRLLHDVLEVAEPQAEIDACKLEHLVSNETARRVLAFLRYFDEDQMRAGMFTAGWRSHSHACDHALDTCPSCESACLAEKVND
jgi:Mn-dependent DtxR family transcriptional regulator